MDLAYLPSPSQGVWQLGPIPIRAYALCIIAGILVAIWLTQRRWKARGGDPDDILDVALWAVPFGIVGGRIYHVHHRPRAVLHCRAADRSRRSTSGTAASASGGRSRLARSAPGSAAAAAASNCSTSATPSPRAWCWPRPSVGGATTSTRSSTAGPPPCRGHCGSTRPTGRSPPRRSACITPRSSTNRLWDLAPSPCCCCGSTGASPFPAATVRPLRRRLHRSGAARIEALRVDHANHILGLRLNDWTSLIVFLAALAVLCWRRRQPTSPADAQPTIPRP